MSARPCAYILHLLLTSCAMVKMSESVFWIQPGMNHIVACCNIISFNATELTAIAKQRPTASAIALNETLVADVDFLKEDASSLSLPQDAVVLPLVPSFNFQLYRWYNVCVTHKQEQNQRVDCFPARPCDCDCDEEADGGWLKILVNATFKSQNIHLRLLSTFSPDNLLGARFNVTLQSKIHYELCRNLKPPDNEYEKEQYQMRVRQCRREPPPIHAHQIQPKEEIQISQKDVNGLPFYITISITITEGKKYFGREIVHRLESIQVNANETGGNGNQKGGNFERWITVSVPTPRIEEEHGPALEWHEEDSQRICPLVQQADCSASPTCNTATTSFHSFITIYVFVALGVAILLV